MLASGKEPKVCTDMAVALVECSRQDLDSFNTTQDAPLHRCLLICNPTVFSAILKTGRAKLDLKNGKGWRPLGLAVKQASSATDRLELEYVGMCRALIKGVVRASSSFYQSNCFKQVGLPHHIQCQAT